MELKQFLFIIFAISLVGCATQSSVANSSNPNMDATVQLAEAAASISESLNELAAIEKAAIKPAKKPLPITNFNDPSLNMPVSIDWSGPIGPLVKKLGSLTNYRVRILGAAPAIPIIVTINAKDTPLGDILRDAAFQAGSSANIYILASTKTIELRYNR